MRKAVAMHILGILLTLLAVFVAVQTNGSPISFELLFTGVIIMISSLFVVSRSN